MDKYQFQLEINLPLYVLAVNCDARPDGSLEFRGIHLRTSTIEGTPQVTLMAFTSKLEIDTYVATSPGTENLVPLPLTNHLDLENFIAEHRKQDIKAAWICIDPESSQGFCKLEDFAQMIYREV